MREKAELRSRARALEVGEQNDGTQKLIAVTRPQVASRVPPSTSAAVASPAENRAATPKSGIRLMGPAMQPRALPRLVCARIDRKLGTSAFAEFEETVLGRE